MALDDALSFRGGRASVPSMGNGPRGRVTVRWRRVSPAVSRALLATVPGLTRDAGAFEPRTAPTFTPNAWATPLQTTQILNQSGGGIGNGPASPPSPLVGGGPDAPVPTYRIQDGDTPWSLAQRFTGSARRYSELRAANPAKAWDRQALNPFGAGPASTGSFASWSPGETIALPTPWIAGASTVQSAYAPAGGFASVAAALAAYGIANAGLADPPDYGQSATDLASAPDARFGRAVRSYQLGNPSENLRGDGVLDDPTYQSIMRWAAGWAAQPQTAAAVAAQAASGNLRTGPADGASFPAARSAADASKNSSGFPWWWLVAAAVAVAVAVK